MMEEREFAKYAFLIVAVVAVVGLLTSGSGLTGFMAKSTPVVSCAQAKAMTGAYCKDMNTVKCKNAQLLISNVCHPSMPTYQPPDGTQ